MSSPHLLSSVPALLDTSPSAGLSHLLGVRSRLSPQLQSRSGWDISELGTVYRVLSLGNEGLGPHSYAQWENTNSAVMWCNEWPYWFRPRGHPSQHPASKVTVCVCLGESRNRTDVANTFPEHSPRFSLFSAEEISQAISVYSKTPSDLSTYKVHVHLNPWIFFASVTSLEKIPQTVCVEILSQMSLTCICLVGEGRQGGIILRLMTLQFLCYDQGMVASAAQWTIPLLENFRGKKRKKKRRDGLSSSQSSFWKWSLPHETSIWDKWYFIFRRNSLLNWLGIWDTSSCRERKFMCT